MKHVARVTVAALVVVGLVGTIRTWRITSRQPEAAPATVPPAPVTDLVAALAEAIQYRTISYDDPPPDPEAQARAFGRFDAFLRFTFPRTLATAERIAGHSLLVSLGPSPAITIDGAAPAAGLGRGQALAGAASAAGPAPHGGSLLYAHLDVVPATAEDWSADPFGGTRTGDSVVGRGALDDKSSVIAILAATESLLASGWTPARPVFLAFGDNEEAGGSSAAAIAGRLREQGITLESILDEGGGVVDTGVPGLGGRPIAAVAIAEKGVMNVEICAAAAPGHSSTPPATTAVGTLSAAITRLEEHPPARSLNPLVRETLTYAAAEMSLGYRALMANLWLTAPLIRNQIEKDRVARAQLGTSQAVTMIRGGVKANVLPERACATVNYRLFPGDTPELVLGRISTLTKDLDVQATAGESVPPPAPSDLDSAAGRVLSRTIRAHFPDSVIVPVVSPGATDSRHFAGIAGQIFRFLPVHLSGEDLASLHGVNERISAASLTRAYAFYVEYLRAIGQ